MDGAHRNNFDFIRFLAATMVWYGHCYLLFGKGPDWLPGYIPFETFGALGVTIFFIVSGYFITMSYDRNDSFLPFLRNRCLRVFPALMAVVLVSTLVMGPLVTSLKLSAYFAHEKTWTYLKSMLIFPLHYELPGVFDGKPVNGSLWSLKHEVRCYGVIALLGVLGILRPRLMFVLLVALCAIRLYGAFKAPPPERLFGKKWGDLELMVRLGSQFAAGSLLYLAHQHFAPKASYFCIALLLTLLSTHMPEGTGKLLFDLSLSYVVITIGFVELPLLAHFGRLGDFSYGIYLWAFPMQQLSFYLYPRASFSSLLYLSGALTLLCAVLSWHLIEKRALRLKQ